MAEFNLESFTNAIRQSLYDQFPYLKGRGFNANGTPKHGGKNTPPFNEEIREVALMRNSMVFGDNKIVFDVGNKYAETHYPYYHILNDAEVIRKRGKGTTKTKGSQDKIEKLSERDYGIVSWNGKTYSREYRRNVRGKRSLKDKATRIVKYDGGYFVINKNANYYYNEHYNYINNILDSSLPLIAQNNGLKILRKVDAGLGEDFNSQHPIETTPISVENILDIFDSFN